MSEDLQTKIDQITARYQPEIDRLQAEGQAIGDDAGKPGMGEVIINVDFDMEWKERELIFDVPTITMRERRMSLDLPKVTGKRQRIVFHTPSIRMENRVVGKYPVFRGFKVTMKDIIMKVPVHFMEKQEIIYDIPEVRMERKDISMKVPEFGKKRQRWVLKLPEFTAKNVKVEARKLQEKGEELRRRGEDLGKRMQTEIQALVASTYGILVEEGNDLRQDVEESFTGAIHQVKAAIDDLTARKIDPVKIPAEGGTVNLRKTLAELVAERDAAVAKIDEALAEADDEAPAAEPALA